MANGHLTALITVQGWKWPASWAARADAKERMTEDKIESAKKLLANDQWRAAVRRGQQLGRAHAHFVQMYLCVLAHLVCFNFRILRRLLIFLINLFVYYFLFLF